MYKILIADDEALMRKGLCTLIDWAKLGCQIVGTAENGLQAKQAVLDYQPDIIIADIKMPVMDGLELARWVCGAQRQIQIIYAVRSCRTVSVSQIAGIYRQCGRSVSICMCTQPAPAISMCPDGSWNASPSRRPYPPTPGICVSQRARR